MPINRKFSMLFMMAIVITAITLFGFGGCEHKHTGADALKNKIDYCEGERVADRMVKALNHNAYSYKPYTGDLAVKASYNAGYDRKNNRIMLSITCVAGTKNEVRDYIDEVYKLLKDGGWPEEYTKRISILIYSAKKPAIWKYEDGILKTEADLINEQTNRGK